MDALSAGSRDQQQPPPPPPQQQQQQQRQQTGFRFEVTEFYRVSFHTHTHTLFLVFALVSTKWGIQFYTKKEHFWPLIDLTSDDCQSSCRRNEIKEIQKKNKGRRWRRGPPGGTGVGHREPRPITTRHIFTEFCVCVFYFLVSPPLRNACDVTEMASVFCFVFFWRRFRRRSVSGRHRSGNAGRFSPSLSLSLSLCLLGRFTELFTEFFRCGTVHGRGRRVGRFTGVSLSLSLWGCATFSFVRRPPTGGLSRPLCFLVPQFGVWALAGPRTDDDYDDEGLTRDTHTHTERERERDGDEIMATVDTHDAGTQTSTPHHNKGATRRQRRRRASQEAEESGAAHTGPVTDDMQKTHTHTHTHTHPTLDWDSTVTRRPRFSAATMQLGRATAEDSTAAAANRPSNASETVTNGGSSPHRHTHTHTDGCRKVLPQLERHLALVSPTAHCGPDRVPYSGRPLRPSANRRASFPDPIAV